ncbi:hypothetical protein DFP72DRAFT_400600 [Ephemerocybe angulata]|uniref:Uncharacterized protein n=1 Tax=Ephemerocybe angulata TaxID=980116 RepID=A0A8H6M708_9AGAR|nr:hypothetical protein DFP72DRAFT_400600 [Tulosesus angulatus]
MEVSIRAGENGCLVCIRFLPFLPFHLLSRPQYISFIFFSIPIYSLYPFPPTLVLVLDLSSSSPSSTRSPSAPIPTSAPSSLPRPAFSTFSWLDARRRRPQRPARRARCSSSSSAALSSTSTVPFDVDHDTGSCRLQNSTRVMNEAPCTVD